MIKRILVPLDGSDLAEGALPYAEQIAGRRGPKSFSSRRYTTTIPGRATRPGGWQMGAHIQTYLEPRPGSFGPRYHSHE